MPLIFAHTEEELNKTADDTVARNSSPHALEHKEVFEIALSQRPKPLRSIFPPNFDTPTNSERYKKNILLFETLYADAQILLNSPWIPSLTEGPQPYIFFGFADDSRLNASAQVLGDGKCLLCFHTGLPLIFYSVFCRLMAHPNVLPKIGNASMEIAEGPHAWNVPAAIRDYEDIVQARFQASQNADTAEDIYLPCCPIRRGFARRLTQCALLFLLYHECAHLQYGHTLFKRMVNKKGSMNNIAFMEDNPEQSVMNWATDDGYTPLLEQSLEYDADSLGANYSIRLHHLRPAYMSEISTFPNPLPNFPNSTMLIGSPVTDTNPSESWGFAIATTFKLMGFDSNDLTAIGTFDGGHPPAIVRCHLATATVATLHKMRRISVKETESVIDGAVEANNAFDFITSEPPNQMSIGLYQASQSPEVKEFVQRLEQQWQDNLPHLRKLTWWPLTNDPEYEQLLKIFGASLNSNKKADAKLRRNTKDGPPQKKSGHARRPSRRQ